MTWGTTPSPHIRSLWGQWPTQNSEGGMKTARLAWGVTTSKSSGHGGAWRTACDAGSSPGPWAPGRQSGSPQASPVYMLGPRTRDKCHRTCTRPDNEVSPSGAAGPGAAVRSHPHSAREALGPGVTTSQTGTWGPWPPPTPDRDRSSGHRSIPTPCMLEARPAETVGLRVPASGPGLPSPRR